MNPTTPNAAPTREYDRRAGAFIFLPQEVKGYAFRGVTQLTCGVCGGGFNSTGKLTRHQIRKHASGGVTAAPRNGDLARIRRTSTPPVYEK